MTGWVGALSLLDVVPVLNGQIILEAEDFEADIRACEVEVMGNYASTWSANVLGKTRALFACRA